MVRITAMARAIKPPGHQHSLHTRQPGRILDLDLKERFRRKERGKVSLTGISLISQRAEAQVGEAICSEFYIQPVTGLRTQEQGLSAPAPAQLALLRTPPFRLPESPLLSYSGMDSLPAQLRSSVLLQRGNPRGFTALSVPSFYVLRTVLSNNTCKMLTSSSKQKFNILIV